MYKPKLIYKSKSLISFYEYKKKITEIIQYENDWGHYIDIETEPYKMNYVKNDDIKNDTHDIKNDNCVNILYKYSFIVSVSCVSLIILILF